MRKRFQQEARLAARLVRHIVAVLDYGEDDAPSYLVMERLPGTTLRDEIARGPLATPRAVLVITEALSALAAAHKLGVLHRDVKPSNILLQDDGHTKITDFENAKSVDIRTGAEGVTEDMTLTGIILGTPGYLTHPNGHGPPGDGTVRSLLGRRRHGGGTHGAASCSRCHPDGRATSLAARRRTRRALATEPNRGSDRRWRCCAPFASRPMAVVAPQATTQPMAPRPAVTLPVPVTEPATVRGPTRPPGGSRSHRPVGSPTGVRRRRVVWAVTATAAALITILFLLLTGGSQPTGPTAATTSHRVAHTDSGVKAIRALAALARRRRPAGRPVSCGRPGHDGLRAPGDGTRDGGGDRPLARPGAPGRWRHHAGSVPGRRQHPAADRGNGTDDDDHHHDHDHHHPAPTSGGAPRSAPRRRRRWRRRVGGG